ncbi:hypothetical protein ACK301_18770, partial [Aeromonas caviae]
LMMNPFSWLQMTNMISYQGLVRTFLSPLGPSGPLTYEVHQLPKLTQGCTYSALHKGRFVKISVRFFQAALHI